MEISRIFLILAAVLVSTKSAQYDTAYCDGKTVIVHLFEWKWSDVAAECERFLGPAGFCAVQVSPPNEHILIVSSDYPWWQRYQPISYILGSRSGNEAEFTDMVGRCNAAGVRIIVDAVINHMAGVGQSGQGSAGSSFDSDKLDFAGVPYSYLDFTPRDMCPSVDGRVNNYQDPNEVRNCYLVGLTDLYQAKDYVRERITEYFNHVLDIGVMGFRVDASKHMWPGDLEIIEDMTNDLNTDAGFPAGARPFFYHEVIDQGGEPITVDQYYNCGRVTEFRYGTNIAYYIRNDLSQIGEVYDRNSGMCTPEKALVFVDNHDNQRNHGGGGSVLTYKDGRDYSNAVVYTLAQDYGFKRVMSSYYFDNTDAGPPGSGGNTESVIINADGSCGGGWVCEHRWASISRMVEFSNAAGNTDRSNWYDDGSTVAFSRGSNGFFAMNLDGNLNMNLQTGMPAGEYCDLITACAKMVTVNADGTADINIDSYDDPFVAICVGCDGSGTGTAEPPATQGPTEPPITSGIVRTVVFIRKETLPSQDLFIRGGIGEDQRPGCTEDASTDICAIDISTNFLGDGSHYDKYNAWREGDTKLDWYGAQRCQGTYEAAEADGTPSAWTTNEEGNTGYQELNTFGEHYWMLDMDMDCSQTEDGWFELKSYLTNDASGWEDDITQATSCSGSAGGRKPYSSINHLAKCGFVNIFSFDGRECTINTFQ